MIPGHKCTPYCDSDEGIHCLPDFFFPEAKLVDWLRSAEGTDLEVIKVQRDSDVNPRMQLPVNVLGQSTAPIEPDYVGFLIWVREKAST